ncbi:neuronal acetylcholine receptor subunit non-alpha-2-like [Saccostrea echinata]|uniref:neuronal acetylcholine receptor subunit non-alpha-2-like n=1 Tax=Saccostrea echinata TaxID=191078 RepID=UPI002A8249B5|nr:neuronal acetylcholine receptor subunit non-alpha-2-like [Saccostrea echinata]
MLVSPQRFFERIMKKESASLCLFLLLINGMSLTSVRGFLYSDAESLLQDVFQNYSTDIRPKENLSEVVEVSISSFIFSVNDFNEVSGVLSIVSGFMLIWHDFRLTWTPSNYGGIQELPVPKLKLWVPNIFLIDPAKKMEAIGDEDFIGRISYSGIVSWVPADPILPISRKHVLMLDILKLRCLCRNCGKRKKKSKIFVNSAKLDEGFEKSNKAEDKNTQNYVTEEKITWKILAEGYDRVSGVLSIISGFRLIWHDFRRVLHGPFNMAALPVKFLSTKVKKSAP